MDSSKIDNLVQVNLKGRIDSNNAAQIEQDIEQSLSGKNNCPVELNARELVYISSAGLRVLLHIRKDHPDLTITHVNPEVYDILEMTGFTEMMTVIKDYRQMSVEGCEEIGHGANGIVYRTDDDTVVKVYKNSNALEEIKHEREVARLALILGIPTAISYDVVQVGENYGSVFELLNARSFSRILATEPEKMDWCAMEFVSLLKKIHATKVPEGKLPKLKDTVLRWAKFVKDYLPGEAGQKLYRLVEAVPDSDYMIHGDYHTKNVMLQNDEVLLIDMDTLAVGHPVFELGSMYNAFIGFSEYHHDHILAFQGFDFETSKQFWNKVLKLYLGTHDEKRIRQLEDKARVIGYTRLIRRSIRRGGLDHADGKAETELWKSRLLELLSRTDSLDFSLNEFVLDARKENLAQICAFVDEFLEGIECPAKIKMQIMVAVEEIFVNIADYAYGQDTGVVRFQTEVSENRDAVVLTFTDNGIPYNPLERPDPDITVSAEERPIGGLGIFMTKKFMDHMSYEYQDGKNVLTLVKNLHPSSLEAGKG